MNRLFRVMTIAGVIALTGMLATPAHATLQVQINGTNSAGSINGGTICVDNTGCDSNATLGILTWNNVVAGIGFTIQGTTSNSTSPVGELSMTLNGNPTAPTNFTIAVSDTNFSNPGPPLTLSQTDIALTSVNGPTATVTATGFFSSTNTAFVTSGTNTGAAITSVGAAQGVANSGVISSGNPYSLTTFVAVNITSIGAGTNLQVSSDLVAIAVPEPTSIALFGGVLLCSVAAIRRRVRRG